jgi:hypothetical protein
MQTLKIISASKGRLNTLVIPVSKIICVELIERTESGSIPNKVKIGLTEEFSLEVQKPVFSRNNDTIEFVRFFDTLFGDFPNDDFVISGDI